MAVYRFIGGCEFDQLSGELRRTDGIVRLEPQPAAVLGLLASRAGELVTHAEIRRAVWGGETHVSFQDGIHYCISQIRTALGDRVVDSRFVVTVPKRGYRFRADAMRPAEAVMPPVGPNVWKRTLAFACLAAVLATAAVLERRPNNHHDVAVAVLKTVHDLVF